MRFSSDNRPFKGLLRRWVHSSVPVGSTASSDHRAYIAAHLLLGACGLAVLPAFWTYAGSISPFWVGTAVLCTLSLLLAALVSQSGKLKFAACVTLIVSSASLAYLAIVTGGIVSLIVPVLAIAPLETALSGKRSTLRFATACSLVALIAIVMASAVGPLASVATYSIAQLGAAVAGIMAYSIWFAARLQKRRQKSRVELQSADSRFAMIANNVTELVARHDQHGATLFVSPAARPLFGEPASGLLNSGFLEKIHLQDRIVFMQCVSDVARRKCEQTVELRIRCRGASQNIWKNVELHCRPLKDETTGKIEVVSITRDVSSQKQDREAMLLARAQNEETNSAQKRFLATMSHELRTPLNAILGFSEVLENEYFGRFENEKQREYVSLIRGSGQHLLNVVNDLLNMSRIDAGRYEINPEKFALADVAEATINMLGPMAIKAEIQVLCDVSAALPEIIGDRRACQQIFINLLSNAIKFTPAGGEVRVSAKQHGPSLKLKFKDTGIGIASEFMPHLGQPFMQADSGHDRKFEGSGLGLSVVRGFVDLHGGEFNVTSKLGEGTTIVVTLPIRAAASRPVPANHDAGLVRLNPSTAPQAAPSSAANNAVRPSKESKGESRARVSA